MVAKLIGRTGLVAGRDFTMPEDFSVLRIGAASDNQFCIRADGISREHALIIRKADGCWIEDRSINGTFVNGLRIKEERLQHLDVVTLARRIDLIFVETKGAAAPEAAPGVISASLESLGAFTERTTTAIPLGELTLGRSATCNVAIANPSVGKVHAKIRRTASQVTVEDLGSPNGTFVNDRRVKLVELKDGDRIALAGVAQFRVAIQTGTGADLREEVIDNNLDEVYNTEWQTRYVWSPSELGAIERDPAKALALMEAPSDRISPVSGRPARDIAPSPEPPPARNAAPPPREPEAAPPPPVAAESLGPIRGINLVGDSVTALNPGTYVIGRGTTSDIRLGENDREASRVHSIVTVTAEKVTVEDKSSNGTYVNRTRITGVTVLQDGNMLTCGGSTFTVRFIR